jgi:leucyl/phenylalanyl-tRNA--protein transferase
VRCSKTFRFRCATSPTGSSFRRRGSLRSKIASPKALRDGELVGGLYGVSLGSIFFGESMFAWEEDASKIAFATLVEQLAAWGITRVDCQVHTEHLERFGAREIPRAAYLELLADAIERPTHRGRWRLDQPASGPSR